MLDKPTKEDYSLLGIQSNATEAEVKRAYRIKAKSYHPDPQSFNGGKGLADSTDDFDKLTKAKNRILAYLKENKYEKKRPVLLPIAKFIYTADGLTATVDASATTGGSRSSLKFTWDWGDGSADTITTDPITSHRYARPGSYIAKLTAENSRGPGENQQPIIVNQLPVIIDFPLVPHGLSVTINLDAIEVPDGTGPVFTFDWGDGSAVTTTPVHTYEKSGSYFVTVTAQNSEGSYPKTKPVRVLEPLISDYRLKIDHLYVEIYDTVCRPGSEPELLYAWGDGTTSDWPAHGYQRPGPYILHVTATDAGDWDRTKPRPITLYRPRVPDIAPGTPVFRDFPLGPTDLVELARSALQDDEALIVLLDLFQRRALRAFTHFDGCQDYARLDDRWHRNYEALVDGIANLRAINGGFALQLEVSRVDTARLLLAIQSDAGFYELVQEVGAACSPEALSQPWFRRLLQANRTPDVEAAHLQLTYKAARLATAQCQELEWVAAELSRNHLWGYRVLAGREALDAEYLSLRQRFQSLARPDLVEMLEQAPTSAEFIDEGLARIITQISPTIPASFRSRDVTEAGLRALVAEAATSSAASQLLSDLAGTGILAIYSSGNRRDGPRLAQIDGVWTRQLAMLDRIHRASEVHSSAAVNLLRAELEPGYADEIAASACDAAQDKLARRRRWFADLCMHPQAECDVLVTQVALILLRPIACEEVALRVEGLEIIRRQARERTRLAEEAQAVELSAISQRKREAIRMGARTSTIGVAGLSVLAVLAALILLAVESVNHNHQRAAQAKAAASASVLQSAVQAAVRADVTCYVQSTDGETDQAAVANKHFPCTAVPLAPADEPFSTYYVVVALDGVSMDTARQFRLSLFCSNGHYSSSDNYVLPDSQNRLRANFFADALQTARDGPIPPTDCQLFNNYDGTVLRNIHIAMNLDAAHSFTR